MESAQGKDSEVEVVVTPKSVKSCHQILRTQCIAGNVTQFLIASMICVNRRKLAVSKWFLCTDANCKKDFSQKSLMLQHYRSIHEGNPYKCDSGEKNVHIWESYEKSC